MQFNVGSTPHCFAVLCSFSILSFALADPLNAFLSPLSALSSGGSLGPAFVTPQQSASECASACLANSSCISFNLFSSSQGPTKTCGIAHECYLPNASSCPSSLDLSCVNGVFTAVEFASWGLPVVAQEPCGFTTGSCTAPNSVAVVAAACLGQSFCSIPAMASTFGADPCVGEFKFLAAALTGNCSDGPPPAPVVMCQLFGYARDYTVFPDNASYYQRMQPRNDTPYTQVVPYLLDVPLSGVALQGGVLGTAFENGMAYLLSNYDVDDMLYDFRVRAGDPNPPGHCHGWDCRKDWIEGSIAGLFLMGAGGHLRWAENAQLRSMMDDLIDGIENCTEEDGFLAAFAQDKLATSEHPDYTTSWTVHGFLEAAIAGNPKALGMIRRHMNVFNNHTLLPTFLPPDGGNPPYQTPDAPASSTGHSVYLIYQGLIHSTRMALSSVGVQADVDLITSIYQEPWWLRMLSDGVLDGVWRKAFYPHNYEVTAFEAYLDMYVLTGESSYLSAVMAAWRMFRDPQNGWIHVGGSLAINEGSLYEPGSYHLDAGLPGETLRHRDYYVSGPDAHHHDPPHNRGLQVGPYPTGEFCGAVFWLKLNQRMHRLRPNNETFVLEMERELFNEGLAHQGVNGSGIRYFSNLNGQKELPGTEGTCCEGQGSRLYGSIPEYLYSIPAAPAQGVLVDIYAPSNFTFMTPTGIAVNLTLATTWPYGTGVVISLSAVAELPSQFSLQLRMPSWAAGSSIPVTVNGAPGPAGVPGSYLYIPGPFPAGAATVVAFDLPMTITAHPYTGSTQMPPYHRYAYTYGPVLLAATGGVSDWNNSLNTLHIAGLNGSNPASWMAPAGDGNKLHFAVEGSPGVLFQPNWEIQDNYANFSVYPIFDV